MTGASIETPLELWASSLRDVKVRMRGLFTQERVAASAGLFLDGLLGDERRKTGWMRAEAAGDPARMAGSHVPPGTTFATKPALAVQMIARAITADVPFAWVAADSVYGVGDIEQALRRAGKGYVLGVNANHHFGSWAGKPPVAGTADEIAQSLDPSAWRRLSATATRPRSAAGMSQICCMEERSLPDNPRESAEIGGNHTQLQPGLSGPTKLL